LSGLCAPLLDRIGATLQLFARSSADVASDGLRISAKPCILVGPKPAERR